MGEQLTYENVVEIPYTKLNLVAVEDYRSVSKVRSCNDQQRKVEPASPSY